MAFVGADPESRLEERRLRAILESATDYAIITTDLKRRVTSWTAGAHSVLGWSEAEMLGRALDQIFTPEDQAAGVPDRETREALATGRGASEGWRMRHDGSQIWASGEVMLLRDEAGRPEGFVKIVRDRTREQLEREERARAEARLRLALGGGRMAIWEWDFRQDRLRPSPELNRMLGLADDAQPTLDQIRINYRAGDRDRLLAETRDVLDRGDAFYETEFTYRCGDEWRDYLLRTDVHRDAAGRPTYALGVLIDITERKQAEHAAAAAAAQTREILESISDAFYALDDQFRFTYVNARAEQMWNRPRAELLGRLPWEVFPAADGGVGHEAHRTALRERRPVRLETMAASLGRWVELAIYPSEHGLAVYFRDITERRQAEEALRESEQRFRLIADSAPTPMWVTEPGGGRRFANQAYVDFLGVPYDQAVAFDWRKVIHPDDVERVVAESVAGERSLKPFALEGRYRRADGEYRWLRSQSQPRFDGAGRHDGFVGLAYDISESRRAQADLQRINELLGERVAAALAEKDEAETALRQSQRLEAVGQLTSGVAHDFNNLLTVVLGNIAQLARTTDEPTARRRLEMMEQAARRGATLTSQLLAFSRRQRLDPRPVDLNDTVRGMRDLLQSTMGGGVKLETHLEPDLWSAMIDPTQIELAILNLAINGRDAMEVGGTLTVATGNRTLGPPRRAEEPPAGDYVMVCVSDTGAGMTEEVRAKAFEPFFTTKEVGKGSGLGLSQVFGLAKQSGGGMELETRLGEGTTVKIYLPRSLAGAVGDEATPGGEAHAAGRGRVVLVVDDDAAVREVTAAMLEELGYVVLEAGSGAAGLAALDSGAPIDLLVADYAMPGMNGVELARAARLRQPRLPVLYVTGYADLAVIAEADEDQVLQKPFELGALAARTAALLGG